MGKILLYAVWFLSLFISPVFGQGYRFNKYKFPAVCSASFEESPQLTRTYFFEFDRIFDYINMKNDFKVLDIGAGEGYFTFKFSEKLNNTGKVYATEVNLDKVKLIQQKAKSLKHTNIEPVLVSPAEDNFYKKHSFDIIFVCDLYYVFSDAEYYFSQLRPSLAKDGRLYIVQPKTELPFYLYFYDIENECEKIIRILKHFGPDFPVFKKFDKSVQNFIQNRIASKIPEVIMIKIVENLDKMVKDRALFHEIFTFFESKQMSHKDIIDKINKPNAELIKWLVIQLNDKRILEKSNDALILSEKENEFLLKLNNLILTGIFELELHPLIPYNDNIVYGKNNIILTLKEAGFEFVKEYDILPAHIFLEFK